MFFNLFCQFVLCTLHGGADLTFSIPLKIFNVKSFFNEIINILLILVKLIHLLIKWFIRNQFNRYTQWIIIGNKCLINLQTPRAFLHIAHRRWDTLLTKNCTHFKYIICRFLMTRNYFYTLCRHIVWILWRAINWTQNIFCYFDRLLIFKIFTLIRFRNFTC